MTRRKNPFVAHVVLISLVLDLVVTARAVNARPAVAAPAPALAPFLSAPPHAPASIEECDAALTQHQAPVTTLSRTRLWPPNHALIDVGLAVDPTAACAGLVDLQGAVWSDEPDNAPGDGSPPQHRAFRDG